MKLEKLFIILIALVAMSCGEKKTSIDVVKQMYEVTIDTICVDTCNVPVKAVIIVSKAEFDLINTFRPVIKDVAIYMLVNTNDWDADKYNFWCTGRKFQFWTANGYNHFNLKHPVEISLTKKERDYFWKKYRVFITETKRLYEWENDVDFKYK